MLCDHCSFINSSKLIFNCFISIKNLNYCNFNIDNKKDLKIIIKFTFFSSCTWNAFDIIKFYFYMGRKFAFLTKCITRSVLRSRDEFRVLVWKVQLRVYIYINLSGSHSEGDQSNGRVSAVVAIKQVVSRSQSFKELVKRGLC